MNAHVIGIGLLWALCWVFVPTTQAACDDTNIKRSFIGQPADLVFMAGVPETKYIRQVWAIWPSQQGARDCGAVARSTLRSVKVRDTYCPWEFPANCTITAQAQVDDASGPLMLYVAREENHIREVPVIYDGQARAGTVGSINFGQQSEIGLLVAKLGSVNVRIVRPGAAASGWLTVTAARNNVRGDSLEIDHPLLNGNPRTRVFAMHMRSTTSWNHPIAVAFDRATGRWHIRNEDGVAMPVGLSFVVRVDPSARVIYTASGPSQRFLIINDPVANNNPYAVIIATPTSSGKHRMRHPFGVAYVAPHWQVLYTDGASMPTSSPTSGNAGFMIKVFGGGQYIDDTRPTDPSGFRATNLSDYVGTDIVAAAARVAGATKMLRNFCWTGGTKTRVLATFNMTPLPPPAPINYNWVEAKYYGVAIGANSAEVFHQDGTRMDERTPFNVWGEFQSAIAIPHCRRSGGKGPGSIS